MRYINRKRSVKIKIPFRRIVSIACILFAAYTALSLMLTAFLVHKGNSQIPQKSDVIFVLGGDIIKDRIGKETRERLNKGMELFRQGYGKKIIVSGGKSRKNTISGGEAMKNYLVEQGIGEEFIIVEGKATNTYEHFVYSRPFMEREGFKTSLLVTSHYHLIRSLSSARKQGYQVSGAASPVPPIGSVSDIKYLNYWIREVPALVKNTLRYGVTYW